MHLFQCIVSNSNRINAGYESLVHGMDLTQQYILGSITKRAVEHRNSSVLMHFALIHLSAQVSTFG